MVGRGGGEGCSLETSIVCSQAVQQGFRVRPGKGVGFWSACTGASVAWGALGELQQAPMATAHRVSGTPTPGRSARAGRKRDGIPWHSPLAEVVKGALYRVFWTPGITRRLQVQHLLITVREVRTSETKAGRVEMIKTQIDAFVRTDRQRQFLKQQVAAIGMGFIEGAAKLETVEHLGLNAFAKQEIEGFVGKKLRR